MSSFNRRALAGPSAVDLIRVDCSAVDRVFTSSYVVKGNTEWSERLCRAQPLSDLPYKSKVTETTQGTGVGKK